MVKRISFIALLAIVVSCSKPIELQGFDKESWIQDKDGCSGTRKELIDILISQKSELLGKEQEQITELLGKPDKHELYKRSQYFLVYSIDPGVSCPNTTADKKIANLTIRFNALGRVNEVVYYK